MEHLNFTTRVLGTTASQRLENEEVTQTIRNKHYSIVQAKLQDRLRVGDQIQIVLDNRMIGLAEYLIMDAVRFDMLDQDDAKRGGFDTLKELTTALRRAGYRFKPINIYQFYRIQFSWLPKYFSEEY